ncbi:PIN domain-containing protein [Iamia sp.]|uniref:PIN domain-containing protein n=1 Tax=Iamia sp. TaxID=2722710 RepID=UPI0039C8761E
MQRSGQPSRRRHRHHRGDQHGGPRRRPGRTHLVQLRGLLSRASMLPTTPVSYDDAAALHRRCRRHGQTVRKLIDCLIAAVAIDARGHDPARGCRLQRSRRAHPPADPPVVSAPRTREPRARLLGGS